MPLVPHVYCSIVLIDSPYCVVHPTHAHILSRCYRTAPQYMSCRYGNILPHSKKSTRHFAGDSCARAEQLHGDQPGGERELAARVKQQGRSTHVKLNAALPGQRAASDWPHTPRDLSEKEQYKCARPTCTALPACMRHRAPTAVQARLGTAAAF